MFTVLEDYDDRVIPLDMATKINRSFGAYGQVLHKLNRCLGRYTSQQWELTAIMMDFEQALFAAVET